MVMPRFRPDNLASSGFDVQERQPMHPTNHVPPERMTAEQRRAEVASLLAHGLVRLRDSVSAQSSGRLAESEFELGFSGRQRLHTHPVNNPHEEAA
jgi:hypothetical protein